MKTIIISGTSRGLGRSFMNLLKNKNKLILLNRVSLDEDKKNPLTEFIKCDLKNPNEVISKIKKSKLLKKSKEIIFINNAGIIDPIVPISQLNMKNMQDSLNINFLSPISISNYLCSLNKKIKIINISSGAAIKPIAYWSMYCSTKAATRMFMNVLKNEEKATIVNIYPGIMNTLLQEKIRQTKFPDQNKFIKFQSNKQLKNSKDVARKILLKEKLI